MAKDNAAPAKPGPGYSPQEVAAAVAARDASTKGNPGVVLGAFCEEEIQVSTLRIYPMTMGVFLFLEKRKNPIACPGTGNPTTLQMSEALFALSRTPAQVKQLRSMTAEQIEAAVWDLASTVPLDQLASASDAIGNRVETMLSTVIGGQPEAKKKEEPPARSRRGSAGR